MKRIPTRWLMKVVIAGVMYHGVLNGQVFEEMYSFELFGTNGDSPHAGLMQANDGNFYGTTFYGGQWDWGAVFKMTPKGEVTALASFNGTNTDQHPISTLVEATDGNFYGATDGAVFRVTPAGGLSLFGCGIARTANQLVLSWRTNYTGFTLQSSSTLGSSHWNDCTNSAFIFSGKF